MILCVFEDRGVFNLEPLTLTRPAFELWCGARSLLNRQLQVLPATEFGLLVRPSLGDLCRHNHPQLPSNDADWLRRQPTMLVNSRWLLPPGPFAEPDSPRIGCVGEEVAYAILPSTGVGDLTFDNIENVLSNIKATLPRCKAGGTLMKYPWDLVDQNPQALLDEMTLRKTPCTPYETGMAIIGPHERLFVDRSANIEPLVLADTRNGPIIIDRGANVQSFSRLEGPCYIGPEAWIHGAKLRGGTIGPKCHIGGEVEASIVQAHSNKYHDGFLGHSYVGEWVNLAAGTQTSDLRNDYGPIKVSVGGVRVSTGRNKIGSFIGDHIKTGLNTLLNCGTSVGAFCNLLPTGSYLPTTIPSFTLCSEGMIEQSNLRPLFQTAATVMRRRGAEFSDIHASFYSGLFEATSESRRQVHRDHEQRRHRKSN